MPPYSWLLATFFHEENSGTDDRENHLQDIQKYRNFISKIASRIAESGGSNATWDQVEEDISDILTFQWKLSKV